MYLSTARCDDDDFTIHDPRGGGDDEDDNNWRHNDITTQTMRCVELRESCAGPMKEEEDEMRHKTHGCGVRLLGQYP